jgi:preprotein translocase subunit Sec61beta
MADDNRISMPGVFGGLIRYDEEVGSKFKLSPGQVIGFIALIILFVMGLKFLMPIGPTGA